MSIKKERNFKYFHFIENNQNAIAKCNLPKFKFKFGGWVSGCVYYGRKVKIKYRYRNESINCVPSHL